MDKWRFPLKILQHLKYPFKTYSHSSYGFSFFVQAIFIPSRLDWRTFLSVLTTHCAIQVNDLLTFGSSNISIFLPKLITILLIIWPLHSFSGSRAGSKWQWHWPISSGPKLHSRCPRSQVWSRNLLPLFNHSNNEQNDGPSWNPPSLHFFGSYVLILCCIHWCYQNYRKTLFSRSIHGY